MEKGKGYFKKKEQLIWICFIGPNKYLLLVWQNLIKLPLPYDPANSLMYLPERNKNICPQKDLYKNLLDSFTHSSPKVETTKYQHENG